MKLRTIYTDILSQGLNEAKVVYKEFVDEGSRISNSRLHQLLEPLYPESLVYLAATVADKQFRAKIAFELEVLRDIKLDIDGSDLIAAGFNPAPSFKDALSKTLSAKLDGIIKTKEQELEFAIARLRQLEKRKVSDRWN